MVGPVPIDPALLERSAAPFLESRTLPAEAFTSPDVLEWELEHFFQGSWVCAGRADELEQPGDQQAVRIGSEAVLLVRGKDARLRGFFNTCRHRGHELLPCGAPPVNRRTITCPYHSWTYGLDGAYRTAPGFGDRPGFDRDDPGNALAEATINEWNGWVFVNCSGEGPSFDEHVGNLDDALRPFELDRVWIGATQRYEVAANWKIVSENYHECEHCLNIHPELCRVTPPDSGVQFEPTGLVVGGWMDLMDHAETMSLTGKSFGVPFRGLDHEARRRVLYLGLLPDLLISAHPDYVMTHRLEPLSPDRTRVDCAWLFPPEAREREDFDPSYAVEFWDLTNRQDWAACEGVQRGVAGRGYRQGPLAESELGVYQFMATLAGSYLRGRLSGPVPKVEPARLDS